MKKHILTFFITISLIFLTACQETNINDLPENTADTEQEPPSLILPQDIILKDTLNIMESYIIDNMNVEVGYDEDYNIFVNFNPDTKDSRIPVRQAHESTVEWLEYTSNIDDKDEKRNIDMFCVEDSITGDNCYFLNLFFATAPYNVNELYIYNVEENAFFEAFLPIETKAKLVKENDVFSVLVPSCEIEQNLKFSSYSLNELKEKRDSEEWDNLNIDVTFNVRNYADSFTIDGDKIKTKKPASIDNEEWSLPLLFEIVYEIRNGVIFPLEYVGFQEIDVG